MTVATLRRDRRGSVAMEASILLPLLVLAVFLFFQGALVILAAATLEGAAWEAERALRAGADAEAALSVATQRLRLVIVLSRGEAWLEPEVLGLRMPTLTWLLGERGVSVRLAGMDAP